MAEGVTIDGGMVDNEGKALQKQVIWFDAARGGLLDLPGTLYFGDFDEATTLSTTVKTKVDELINTTTSTRDRCVDLGVGVCTAVTVLTDADDTNESLALEAITGEPATTTSTTTDG